LYWDGDSASPNRSKLNAISQLQHKIQNHHSVTEHPIKISDPHSPLPFVSISSSTIRDSRLIRALVRLRVPMEHNQQ
jgi:hypothetical protein